MGADYIYACARVRANEKNLLTHDQLNMMAESKTAEDAMKMLQDAQYGEGGGVQRPSAYERLLLQETERLYRLMKEVAPGEKSFRIFFCKNTQFSNRRIFFQYYLALSVRKYLQRRTFFNSQSSPDLLGNYNSSQIVNSSYYSCSFHIKIPPFLHSHIYLLCFP